MSGKTPSNPKPDEKTKKVLAEVEEVKIIMSKNVAKLADNIDNLEIIDDKTSSMVSLSGQFASKSKTLQRRIWWQNMRLNLIIAGIVILVLGIIIIAVAVPLSRNS